MEIGNRVRVKADGSEGTVEILEGVPHRTAYVDIKPGANAGYVYFRMTGAYGGIETFTLNPYDVDELEVI